MRRRDAQPHLFPGPLFALVVASAVSAACGRAPASAGGGDGGAPPGSPATGAAATAPSPDDARADLGAQLAALGYVEWAAVSEEDLGQAGVVRHERGRAHPGLNLYASATESAAVLFDMDGWVVHRWHGPRQGLGWQHVELSPGGTLYVVEKDVAIVALRWDSSVRWRRRGRFHHDVALVPGGGLWAIERRPVQIELGGRRVSVMDDHLVLVSRRGRVRRRLSVLELLGGELSATRRAELLRALEDREDRVGRPDADDPLNLFHANSIQVITRAGAGPARVGDLLVSLRNLDEVAIVCPRTGSIRWRWGAGELEQQHHPTLLEDGRMLIFDNGVTRRRSRVLELDPRSGEILWSWNGGQGAPLFSHRRGAVERLANGNYLITDSARGRALEITREGDAVWEFLNPLVQRESRGRAAIYRLARLEPSHLERCPAPGLPWSACREGRPTAAWR